MDKIGWLIEQYINNEVYYWCAGGGATNFVTDKRCGGWTTRPHDAIWFARARDASNVLFRLLDGSGRAVEHGRLAQEG